MRMRESFVQAAVIAALEAAGSVVRAEYPMLGRIADIYCLRPDGKVVAVECKERDWSRAVRQARTYQAAADLVYVALPAARVTDRAIEELSLVQIGLLAVTDEGEVWTALESKVAPQLVLALRERNKTRLADPEWGQA